MALFAPRRGDRALDIGCGFGDGTIELAQLVGPSGAVTGLDVVPAFLDLAREAARAAGVDQVSFVAADAETFRPAAPLDYLFARFGTMFFERPGAAFRNLRAMLAPGGRMIMTTWRPLDENPWLRIAKEIARAHLPPRPAEAVSCGPGPFSLADPELVRTLLVGAGFGEVGFVASDAATLIGRSMADAIDFQLALGPAGELVREAGAAGERALPALRDALADALAPFVRADGVHLPSAAWIVHATT
jgi:SAM-dependent methyltransferase